jgi:hypothetical protein
VDKEKKLKKEEKKGCVLKEERKERKEGRKEGGKEVTCTKERSAIEQYYASNSGYDTRLFIVL